MTKELMELADDYAEAQSAHDYMADQGTSREMRDEFPQVKVRLEQTKTALQSAIESLQAENEQLRELMNVYNVGGWTDSLQLIKERDALAAKLAALSNKEHWMVAAIDAAKGGQQ